MVILGLWFVFAQTLIWKPVSTFFSCDIRSCASLFSTSCESDNTGSPQAFFLCVFVPVLAFLWGPPESGRWLDSVSLFQRQKETFSSTNVNFKALNQHERAGGKQLFKSGCSSSEHG